MQLPNCNVQTTNYRPCIYTPIVQILCVKIYYWYKHGYAHNNCSGIEPTNEYVIYGFNTGEWYVK